VVVCSGERGGGIHYDQPILLTSPLLQLLGPAFRRALGSQLGPAGFGNPVVVIGAVAAAVAAAVTAVKMEFFGEDHQAVFVVVEVDVFNQLIHGWFWLLFEAAGRVGEAGWVRRV